MIRLYSSTSIETTLAIGINSSTTSISVASGTAATLLGGVTLAAGNVDQFTVAIDPDTTNEEIVFITANSGDTFTIVRGCAGTSAIAHSGGATVRHVLTSDDLDYFNTAIQPDTLTAKGDMYVATASGTVTRLGAGTNGQVLTADNTVTKGLKWSDASVGSVSSVTAGTGLTGGTITSTGTIAIDTTVTADLTTAQTLAKKALKSPREITTVSATAATGTINFDTLTQGTLYYTSNASGNWTLNVRGDGSTTLNSLLNNGDSITVAFLVTNSSTAYYPTAFTIDGTSVTPKWQGGTAPTAGNASSIDVYVYTIFKTASATYTVFASQTKFA